MAPTRPLGKPKELGLLCQTSSACYLACALLLSGSGVVCTRLVVNMLLIFAFSLAYRWILHARAPSPAMVAAFPWVKKLDGFAIMLMSIAWATGSFVAGVLGAAVVVFVLGDPHKLRAVVFVTSMTSASVSLARYGQMRALVSYMLCNVVALGSFAQHYTDGDSWTIGRLWAWHGGTALAFLSAVVGMGSADEASGGYPLRGFLFVSKSP